MGVPNEWPMRIRHPAARHSSQSGPERAAPSSPYLLEQPLLGQRRPVKPESRRSRARQQCEA